MLDLGKPCPFCGAKPGEKCFDYRNGVRIEWPTKTHKARTAGVAAESYRRRF
jgi:hypothetical protein